VRMYPSGDTKIPVPASIDFGELSVRWTPKTRQLVKVEPCP
jgi:hypothetical protein